MRLPGLLLTVALTAGAQTAPAVYRTLPQSCDTVRTAAILLLQQRGFTIAAAAPCADCVSAQTSKLNDPDGHRLFSNRRVIERYTTRSLQYEKVGPLVQKVHVGLNVQAQLHLVPTGDACQADLRFAYSWYGAEMLLGIPVDGDPSHGESNGRLEAGYLETLQHHLGSSQ